MSKDTIKCKYIFEEDYNPLYVNGAQGGINSLGEIIINFYLERNALPKSQTFSVENGKISKENIDKVEPKDLKNSFVRVFQNGVVMNYQTAKEVHKWLGKHIESLEQIIDEQKDKK
ncbi:hypothetical protein QQ008_15810 [Fulvivirgaceae bacterium BMA10]|uniref:Uncharacterized protein n=1 Tax=Splendidivirga corallicola TaxID=3051826 RepID=A0ABT8KQ59_9BACT|nr:hypothetical protein [Fulvivirgaceae bacterium BMA10]